MLAKQSWRIIRYPDSLLARVLKGRYFKTGNFLKAGLGSNPSFTWRSIVWGRDLFKEGYRWRIGNGVKVDAASDPWIPKEGACIPILANRNAQQFSVAQLILPTGGWNEDMVKDLFLESDANAILNIPLSPMNKEDIIIWHYDSKGFFSVKSAYRLGVQRQQSTEASASC